VKSKCDSPSDDPSQSKKKKNLNPELPRHRNDPKTKTPEYIWNVPDEKSQIFGGLTGQYGGGYYAPSGFCFDRWCKDERIQDDKSKPGYNVRGRRLGYYY
jgi:hypothetical protein